MGKNTHEDQYSGAETNAYYKKGKSESILNSLLSIRFVLKNNNPNKLLLKKNKLL